MVSFYNLKLCIKYKFIDHIVNPIVTKFDLCIKSVKNIRLIGEIFKICSNVYFIE